MNREFLKELGLEDDAIEKIMKEYGKSINDYKEKAEQVYGLESQIDDYKEQLKERDDQLEELKKVDADALQQRIDELQEENENNATEYQEKLEKQAKEFAIQSALRDANVHDAELAQKALDLESITYKDGKLIGFDEQLEDLKENRSFLFKKDEPAGLKGRNPHVPNVNDSSVTDNPFSKDSLNLTKQGILIREDPEKAKGLMLKAGIDPKTYGL